MIINSFFFYKLYSNIELLISNQINSNQNKTQTVHPSESLSLFTSSADK